MSDVDAATDRSSEYEYVMPSLGADMDEGTVIEWNVDVGDAVQRGDVVARVETEKSDIDIEIWRDGVVEEVLVGTNRVVPVGTALLRIRPSDLEAEPAPPASATPAAPPVPAAPPEPIRVDDPTAPPSRVRRDTDVIWATPLARHLGGEHGIALTDVSGSGPGGAIRRRDVLAHLKATGEPRPGASIAEGDATVAPARAERMRAVIAARMAHSNHEIPHYHLDLDVDLGELTTRLAAVNDGVPIGDRVVPTAAFVRATALAASRHGELNGHWISDRFVEGVAVNVAVAISLRAGGLVTPQIHHADRLTLAETMARIRELTAGARAGVMRSGSAAGGSTITVTSLGDRGADVVHGLISPPEVALVGFGRVTQRPWVVDDHVVPRPTVTVSLSADHRATDGATGSRFLATLARHLEHPEEL